MSAIVWLFEHSLPLPFFGIKMKTDLFQSCSHCWIFQICWHVEWSALVPWCLHIPSLPWVLWGNRLVSHWFCFPGASDSKESDCSEGDIGLILGLGKFSGGGNGYPLQYSCLGDPMDRRAWWATVHGVSKSQTQPSNSHTASTWVLTPFVFLCSCSSS